MVGVVNGADSQRENQLPDRDSLDVQSLKALVLAKQAELDSRTTEIENLKLLILKLRRMHFGPRSEKYDKDIKQLELRLEDLEANQAAAEPEPPPPATAAVKQHVRRKPVRRPLPAELPRETETIAPEQESCPSCGGTLRHLGEDVSETLEYVPAEFTPARAGTAGARHSIRSRGAPVQGMIARQVILPGDFPHMPYDIRRIPGANEPEVQTQSLRSNFMMKIAALHHQDRAPA